MVEPASIAPAVTTVKLLTKDLFDIPKRLRQKNLNKVEWNQVENDCKTLKELIDTITTEPDRITEGIDRALFKSEMASAQSRFENAAKLLSKMRSIEIEGIEQVKDASMSTEILPTMDDTSACRNYAEKKEIDEEMEKNEPLLTLISPDHQTEISKSPSRNVEIEKIDEKDEPSSQSTYPHQRNNESSLCSQRWYCCGLSSIWRKQSTNIQKKQKNKKEDKKQKIQKDEQNQNASSGETKTEQNFKTKMKDIAKLTIADRDKESLQNISSMIREGSTNLRTAAEISNKYEAFKPYFARPILPSNCYLNFNILENNEGEISHEAMLKKELQELMNSSSSSDTRNSNTSNQKKNIWTIGVWGNGGMGKSVVLQSLCREEDIRNHFKDGIHFLDIGENAKPIDLIHQLGSCLSNAGYKKTRDEVNELASQSNPNVLSEAAQRCSKVFEGKRILIIVDDIWEKGGRQRSVLRVVEEVMSDTDGGGIVFSTREEKIADEGSREPVHFNYLKPTGFTARAILRSHLEDERNMHILEKVSDEAQDAIDCVLEICGGLKLCLATAGRGLRKKFNLKNRRNKWKEEDTITSTTTNNIDTSEEQKQKNMNQTLIEYAYNLKKTMAALSCEDRAPDYVNLVAVAKSSLDACRHWASTSGLEILCDSNGGISIEEMFYALCTASRQQAMPYCEVLRLWKVEGIEDRVCERVLDQFENLNLLSVSEKEERLEIRLHDRMIDVCIDLANKGRNRVEKWHKKLLNSYIERRQADCGSGKQLNEERCREWWDESKAKGEYIVGNLSRHLVEGGMWKELMWLMSDVRWTMRRRNEGGWEGLNGDFERVLEEDVKNRSYEEVKRGAGMLHKVLWSSWNEIRKNKHVVGFEVHGRMSEEERSNNAVSWYLESIEKYCERPWLRPRWAFLQKRDNREVSQVKVGGRVEAVYWSKDNVINGVGYDGSKVFVTDINELRPVLIKTRNAECIDYCRRSNRVVVGLENGKVEVRNAKSGEMIGNPMVGHRDWVNCVSFSLDCCETQLSWKMITVDNR